MFFNLSIYLKCGKKQMQKPKFMCNFVCSQNPENYKL
jgi:hypothetical protein